MGGQNHQPTNTGITAASAWLSKQIGEGFGLVLQANGFLEDAIILGMDNRHLTDIAADVDGNPMDYLTKTITTLKRSVRVLGQIRVGFDRLSEAAAAEKYRGNPLASKLPDFELDRQFDGLLLLPRVKPDVWDE